MLLALTTTHRPATDLGFLLAKNPARCQTFELSFGSAHVFYPEAHEERCTAALMLELDRVGLTRGRKSADGAPLAPYVNDRPYVASSFMSVAISRVLGTALNGTNKERPELAATAIPLTAHLPVVPCRGGERFLRALFEPLGYEVEASFPVLDERFPEWGRSPYASVTLRAERRLAELLTHLYVLLPVLDDDKHYWIGRDEIEKLLSRGDGWLEDHPEREQITKRFLKRQGRLVKEALQRLVAEEEPDLDASDRIGEEEEARLEVRISLDERRREAVLAVLKEHDARRVIDLGCGEGKLVRALFKDKTFERIAGMDVSQRSLTLAAAKLELERLPERQRERIELFQGSLTYRDARLAGYDAACLVEVIEHVEPSRLQALERVVFEAARPSTVVVTTPNAEYNARFETLPAGRFRHRDHRFEWSRAEFESWASAVANRNEYRVRFAPIGDVDPALGAPTQMAVFSR